MLQRFYPAFFFSALYEEVLVDDTTNPCKIALFNDSAVFDVDLESLNLPFIQQNKVGATLDIDVEITREEGDKLLFTVPEVSWTELPSSMFRYVIIFRFDKEAIPLIHIDLGRSILSGDGTFTLSPSETCVPKIDFSHEACP